MSDDGSTTRVIIHLDLDCFYAQVEQRRLHIPEGKPVAVQQWGSLLAINYDARKYGVKKGDFVDDAKKKCPQIHVPHVDTLGENRKPGHLFDRTYQKAILRRYRVASREIFAILSSMVSVIEKASIDEAFMDVTDMAKERLARISVFSSDFCQDPANRDTMVFGVAGMDKSKTSDKDSLNLCAFPLTNIEQLLCIGAIISREIRHAIYNKLGYTCSTGIACNKLLAKLASPLNKPNGQVVVAPRFVTTLLKSLPMRKIRGLGGKLGTLLEDIYTRSKPKNVVAAGHGKVTAEENSQILTAHAFLQRCGLAELTKHVGQETAAYVHRICQGNDNGEPVEEKKVQVKIVSCVKQFDQRSGSALRRLEELEYWVRLLCEEMVIRCEDERVENKRFPSQLTIQFMRAKPGDKPRTFKLGIAQDTIVDKLYTAAMNVMRLHLDSVFPMAALSMHAKNFYDLDSDSPTISRFFTRIPEKSAYVDLAAERMEGNSKLLEAKRNRIDSPTRNCRRQKISAFFTPSSFTNGSDVETEKKIATVAIAHVDDACKSARACEEKITSGNAQGRAAKSSEHFCEECRHVVSEPRAEHIDFHYALKLSQTQRSDAMANAVVAGTRKKGPIDAFLSR
ncbi:DNA polymerase iota/DNA damage inducible protein [Plasmopara halstedii]|uniref:DNA polymerase iota/DNA damage inducible protein n=1 Tax=Plasmopara halstedii TaxID=4781 RepID=A0A0P1B4X5_PLAHL|nr:DNA polymerase iota/DNA damage inducible protein [Plasmopara halstedii]CEG48784.1 DNA polymerase iota/DNA damage inducible protein [Plasmopara halstedii]|eukprot:XP_024585153.1 DNA polymerase iota/DNA damage inducible protein [Plasmopara halstedii]